VNNSRQTINAPDPRARDLPTLSANLADAPVLAIVRTPDDSQVSGVLDAMARGGIRVLEVSLTVPRALEHLTQALRSLPPDISLGVGTVLTPEDAENALAAGAQFLVTPTVSEAVLRIANDAAVPVVCGALTPTEVELACRAGAAYIKLFPSGALGPGYLRDLCAPFPEVGFVPTGGISLTDISAYRVAGAVAVGLGSPLAPAQSVRDRDWASVTANATAALRAWRMDPVPK
jgi:2-dehydro-3-deoxyphosphogluconate aldolase / (4S)-4-hydroxy-2-oxoglutarate aldolase